MQDQDSTLVDLAAIIVIIAGSVYISKAAPNLVPDALNLVAVVCLGCLLIFIPLFILGMVAFASQKGLNAYEKARMTILTNAKVRRTALFSLTAMTSAGLIMRNVGFTAGSSFLLLMVFTTLAVSRFGPVLSTLLLLVVVPTLIVVLALMH